MSTRLKQHKKTVFPKSHSFQLFHIVFLLSIWSILPGCGDDSDTGAWSNFKPLNEIDKYIQGYYDASLGENASPKTGNPAVYIDFSDGLVQAYNGNENVQIVQAICNKLLAPNIEWYSLGESKIRRLEYNSNQIFNKVSDPSQYKDIMAPIQEAVKKITASVNDALLITDFEEYTSDGKEQFENYPKTYFTDWIKKGNSITFFFTDYTETNKKTNITTQKHLYYTVFTQGKETPTSLVTLIKQAIRGRFALKMFELNNNPYNVSNNYGGKENTGIANSAFSKWVNYNFNGSGERKLPYEVIGMNKPWNGELDKYIQNIIRKEDGYFLNKLFLNASDQSAYKLDKVAVKVYDVSDDYENFARCAEAKNHVPVLVKNSKKDLVWDDQSKKDPIIRECYVPDTKELKQDWIYKFSTADLPEWPEVFDLDKDIFSSHLKNDPGNIELRTAFHPNYRQKNVKKENALIRIDYVIEEVAFNDSNPQLMDFQWNSITKANEINNSLSEAIRNTLQSSDVNPKGKILYSYYLKFSNTKKQATN